MSSILEQLELQFCPPLDMSLLLALFNDLEDQSDPRQIHDLRITLQSLASDAEFSIDDEPESSSKDESSTKDESSAATSWTSFTSPDSDAALGFLRAAFPEVQEEHLNVALNTTAGNDMWDAIASILTEQYICQLEDRGLDDLEMDSDDDMGIWEKVTPKPKPNKKKQGAKFVLGDVRQHRKQTCQKPSAHSMQDGLDPWSKISSVATLLSEFLPNKAPSFFSSYFHNPSYETPYTALCAALTKIGQSNSNVVNLEVLSPIMSEILSSTYANTRSLSTEIELALNATAGLEHEALELVHILRKLDNDSIQGEFTLGVYHSSDSFSVTAKSSPDLDSPSSSSNGERSLTREMTTSHHQGKQKSRPSPYQWQRVPEKKPNKSYSHASFIPSHRPPQNVGKARRGFGNAHGKGGKGDVGELGGRLTVPSMIKRRELLKRAAEAWRGGNSANNNGHVAFHYAEQARQAYRDAETEMLDRARNVVQAKRTHNGDVDLHGTTANEAITIVHEILAQQPPTPDKPLRIITGRGGHSVNRVSVLKPAVKNALREWDIQTWDGGLIVRGRR